MRILWITGQAQWSEQHAAILVEAFGAEIAWAETANNAVDILEKNEEEPFDLIICTQGIVEGDSAIGTERQFTASQNAIGFEAIKLAQETTGPLPVIAMLSGRGTKDDIGFIMDVSNWTINCPADPERLVTYVEEATGKKPDWEPLPK